MFELRKMAVLKIIGIAIITFLIVSVAPLGILAASSSSKQIVSNPLNSFYFNESTCLAYGQSFIKDTISYDHKTAWTINTKPSEIIKTYDMVGNVNAYIINLKTDNKPTGYLLIEAFTTGAPNVMEYGYSGVYYLTDTKHFKNLKAQKIIYTGNRNILTEYNSIYYKAENNEKIGLSKEVIKNDYINKTKRENNYLDKTDYKISQSVAQINNTHVITPQSSVISSVYVRNLEWLSPCDMDDFPGASEHCEVTMGANMLKYWSICRGVPNLIINDSVTESFNSLKTCMKWSSTGGVTEPNGFNGMQTYISNNNLTVARGRDLIYQSNLGWTNIKTQIDNGNVFEMGADVSYYQSGNRGYHSFLGVGYVNSTDGEYVRVVDEWDYSTDHYYKYLWTNISDIWYYRWD